MNTPKTHHPTHGPYGEAAADVNRRLVQGRMVTLEFDAQSRDRDGRLLAYVWVGQVFVNGALVEQGYAQAATFPPNVRHADYFRAVERASREGKRGLWADPAGTLDGTEGSGTGSAAGPAAPSSSPSSSTGGSNVDSSSSSTSSSSPSDGSVHVRGYTRKDGTYVAPHTRRAPRR